MNYREFFADARNAVRNVYYRYGITWLMLALYVGAADQMDLAAPISGMPWHTLVWVFALMFPGSAALYLWFNLRVRMNDIEAAFADNSWFQIYFSRPTPDEARRAFQRYLRERFKEYCNPYELALLSMTAGMVVFLGGFVILTQLNVTPTPSAPWQTLIKTNKIRLNIIPEQPIMFSQLSASDIILTASFLGALSGAMILVLKRYRTFDLYPSTYLQASVAIVAGTIGGGILSGAYPVPGGGLYFLAFAIGMLTALKVDWLVSQVRERFAHQTGTTAPTPAVGNLDRIIQNPDAIESLNNMSVFSIGELIETHPIRLYINLPQAIGAINLWLDEGLLDYYFAPERDALHAAHVKRFSQLVDVVAPLLVAVPPVTNAAAGPPVITGVPSADAAIARSVENILCTGIHHRLLGLLSSKYRTYFGADSGVDQGVNASTTAAEP